MWVDIWNLGSDFVTPHGDTPNSASKVFTSDDDDFPKGSVDTYKGEPWVEVEVECNMFEVSPTVHGKPESKKCNDHWVYSIFKNISRSW